MQFRALQSRVPQASRARRLALALGAVLAASGCRTVAPADAGAKVADDAPAATTWLPVVRCQNDALVVSVDSLVPSSFQVVIQGQPAASQLIAAAKLTPPEPTLQVLDGGNKLVLSNVLKQIDGWGTLSFAYSSAAVEVKIVPDWENGNPATQQLLINGAQKSTPDLSFASCRQLTPSNPACTAPGGRVALPRIAGAVQAETATANSFFIGDDQHLYGTGTMAQNVSLTVPTKLFPNLTAKAVSAAEDFRCFLGTDDKAACWGAGGAGQLGLGGTDDHNEPHPVVGDRAYAKLAVAAEGQTVCAVDASGQAFCWGRGSEGEIGNGAQDNQQVPTPVKGGLRFQSIAASDSHVCGVTVDGDAYCWGENAANLGSGNPTIGFNKHGTDTSPAELTAPTLVLGGVKFSKIVTSFFTTCGLSLTNDLYCWGLAANSTDINAQPTLVATPLKFVDVAVGRLAACAIGNDHKAYCLDKQGQPQPLAAVPFRQLSISLGSACGVAEDGRAYCWGAGASGALGTGCVDDSATPLEVSGF